MPLNPFATMTTPGQDAAAYSGERLINYSARQSNGISPVVLVARGGLSSFAQLDSGEPVQCMTHMGGSLYAVCGGAVYRVTTGTVPKVGEVPHGVANIAAGRKQVAIVAGGEYYICNGTETEKYTAGALTDLVDVAHMDGYFIPIGSSGGRADALTISGIDDGTSFNALEFAFVEESPDALVNVVRDHGRLWLFGTETVQIFYNSGDVSFPFVPVQGALIEHGCVANTPSEADNSVFWVRPDGAVLRSGGQEPAIISTPEIKEELEKSSVVSGCTFSENGAEYYSITRRSGTSLVYDLTTGMWHERASGVDESVWQATGADLFKGQTFFACSNGAIATSSSDVFTDFGNVMVSEAISPPIQRGADLFRIPRIHMNFLGGKRAIGRSPEVMLQMSEDGVTWSREKKRDLQKKGVHQNPVKWHSLGAFRRAQIRVRVTDPIERNLIGVDVDVQYG